jgi:hypothetical protein
MSVGCTAVEVGQDAARDTVNMNYRTLKRTWGKGQMKGFAVGTCNVSSPRVQCSYTATWNQPCAYYHESSCTHDASLRNFDMSGNGGSCH